MSFYGRPQLNNHHRLLVTKNHSLRLTLTLELRKLNKVCANDFELFTSNYNTSYHCQEFVLALPPSNALDPGCRMGM